MITRALLLALAALLLAPPAVLAQGCEGSADPASATGGFTGCPPYIRWTFRLSCRDACGDIWKTFPDMSEQANGMCVAVPLPGESTHCIPKYEQLDHVNGMYAVTSAFDKEIFAGCRKTDDLHFTEASCPCAPACGALDPKDPAEPLPEHDVQEPLVIGLRDGGLALTSVAAGVRFDLDADGVAEQVAWTAAGSDDAFLVLDRDQNGSIDHGRELFGDVTPQLPSEEPNGFRALVVFDDPLNGGDEDGRLTGSDRIYPYLRLWTDANHDGRSQAGELAALAEHGIDGISLDYDTVSRRDRHGNLLRYRARVFRSGGGASPLAWGVFLTVAD